VPGLEEEARADFDIEIDLYAAVLARSWASPCRAQGSTSFVPEHPPPLHPALLRRCQATRSRVADDHERSMTEVAV